MAGRIEALPEAAGPGSGFTASPVGPPVRLLVVGESTAAGCGAQTHEEAFTGTFARALEGQRGRQVRWDVRAKNGSTIRRVRHRMLPEVAGEYDVAVLMIGANDAMARTALRDWRDDLAATIDELSRQAETVIVTGVPPFGVFPALPRLLREQLAEQGRALDGVAQRICAERPGVFWVASPEARAAEPGFFARDGFHPSAQGYAAWAQHVASHLLAGPSSLLS